MFEKVKLIFKFWFRNGTYIEKEVKFDEDTPEEDIEAFNKALPGLFSSVKKCFRNSVEAEFNINNLIVKCSELIAFDIIPITEESEGENEGDN